jgi:cholesterol transport system auxiliary component
MGRPQRQRAAGGTRGAPRLAGVVMIVVALTGCGGGPPPITFDLSQRDTMTKLLHARRQLVVTEPSAVQPVDSNRIIVRRPDGSLATLANTAWADSLPKLIQSRVVQAFENAGALGHVGMSGGPITPDVTLDIEIRDFEIDVGAGQARVEIAARLVNAVSGRTVAARISQATVPTAGEGPSAVEALDQALGQVLSQLIRWAAPYI